MSHCIKDLFWSYYGQGFEQTPNPKSGSKMIVFYYKWVQNSVNQQTDSAGGKRKRDLHLWLWHLFLLNLFPEHGVEEQRSSAVMDQSRGLLQCVQIRNLCADTHRTHSKKVTRFLTCFFFAATAIVFMKVKSVKFQRMNTFHPSLISRDNYVSDNHRLICCKKYHTVVLWCLQNIDLLV